MHYVGATIGSLVGLWFLLAAIKPTTAMRLAAIRMTSTRTRAAAGAVGLVLLIFSAPGFFPN
jgi:hypothetical protein